MEEQGRASSFVQRRDSWATLSTQAGSWAWAGQALALARGSGFRGRGSAQPASACWLPWHRSSTQLWHPHGHPPRHADFPVSPAWPGCHRRPASTTMEAAPRGACSSRSLRPGGVWQVAGPGRLLRGLQALLCLWLNTSSRGGPASPAGGEGPPADLVR